jgi:hypothetical protein
MVKIRHIGMMNHTNPHYIVSSAGLRFKVPLKERVQSGLRLREACTFPLCLALELEFSDKSEVKISPTIV